MASINFDFTTGVLPPGITFARASSATYIDYTTGLLQTAPNDVARFQFVSGGMCLLVEPAATNLLLQSNGFSTIGSWQMNGGTMTPNQFTAPDGSNNGWAFGDGNSLGWLITPYNITYSNSPYTLSLWVMQMAGSANSLQFDMDSIIKVTPTSPALTRLSATSTPPAGPSTTGFRFSTSNGSVAGIYGAQLETGSVMTSYIPTTTAPATRAADVATFTIPAGVIALQYTFDNNSTQMVSVAPGSYTIPTNLARLNIKSIVSLFAFDFTSGSLPSAITFARASSGTYLDSLGNLQTAANNVARFQFAGGSPCLLIEPTATNFLLDSNNFASANWTLANSAVLTPSQFATPDGGNNGWSLTSGVGNGGVQQAGIVYTNSQYLISFWDMRIVGTATMKATLNATSSGNITCGVALARVQSANIIPAAGTAPALIFVNIATPGSTNGLFGAQLELGTTIVTSYIPTTSAPATRAADVATFTIPANINQLIYTFDDGSTQTLTVPSGSYTIPTTLARLNIRSIVGVPFQGFDFTTGSLPAGITFTRASSGTYFDVNGIMRTAANDVPRFQYAGGSFCLLIEPAATNIAIQSNNFSSTPWNGSAVVTPNQFVSPDGSNNGWAMVNPTASATWLQSLAYSAVPYTNSIWAILMSGTAPFRLFVSGTGSGNFTPATLTRLSFTFTAAGITSNHLYQITTPTNTKYGIYGSQLELGLVPTSYIPTTTVPASRAADVATFTIPAGVTLLNYTFDDDTCQTVPVTAGSYTIPTNLVRPNIQTIAFLSPNITIQGVASATAASVAIPAHQPGDLLFVVARNTAAVPVAPAAGGTVPTWISLQAGNSTNPTVLAVYAIATATNHTTGTWVTLTDICVMVLRPLSGFQLLAKPGTTLNATTGLLISYPALTLLKANGTSFGIRVGARSVATPGLSTPPSGWAAQIIQPAGATTVMVVSTLFNMTASPVVDTVALPASAAYRGYTIEVIVGGSGNPIVTII